MMTWKHVTVATGTPPDKTTFGLGAQRWPHVVRAGRADDVIGRPATPDVA